MYLTVRGGEPDVTLRIIVGGKLKQEEREGGGKERRTER